MAKLQARDCLLCGSRFPPKRANQRYCSAQCRERDKTIRKRQSQPEVDRKCALCRKKLSIGTRSQAIYCSAKCRAKAYRAVKCTYCGMIADSKDHVIPKAYLQTIQDIQPKKTTRLVPACRECNSTAGSKAFLSIAAKRRYIQSRYRKKYARLLSSPDWNEEELAEMGHTLVAYIRGAQRAKAVTEYRLEWKGNPGNPKKQAHRRSEDEKEMNLDTLIPEAIELSSENTDIAGWLKL